MKSYLILLEAIIVVVIVLIDSVVFRGASLSRIGHVTQSVSQSVTQSHMI